MLDSASRLNSLGLDLIWCAQKSKRPIELAWAKRPRKSWEQLKASYKYGYNLGVRLGTPLGVGFLACVDCDVKSIEKRHEAEMLKTLKELGLETGPTVHSGRGNGSCHIYGITAGVIKGKTLAKSSEIVKVSMPSSVKAAAKEKAELTPSEIKAGIRLRPAWEISVYGGGRQMVLPPSIHPDSGEPYKWEREPVLISDFPFLMTCEAVSATPKAKGLDDKWPGFEGVEVDLDLTDLDSETKELIREGTGCDDKSAGIFSAAIRMVKAGMSDQEIMSVLTDVDNYLGITGFEHAQTDDRATAAAWVWKYTIVKAKREALDLDRFAEAAEISPLDSDSAIAQVSELTDGDWQDGIERTGTGAGAKPKSTVSNVVLIFKNVIGDFLAHDKFTDSEHYTKKTPWGGKIGKPYDDSHLIGAMLWLNQNFRFEPSVEKVFQAFSTISRNNAYHPIKDYLEGLLWDGKPRIDTWLKDYLGAIGPEPYLSDISRKFMTAMVKRIYEPGCAYDQVLILEGPQGCGKSSTARILGGQYMCDTHINIGDKDAVIEIQKAWLFELGELSSMRKAEVDMLKNFISRQVDMVRPAYGRVVKHYPRHCVFMGTTNQSEFLKDMTGNRRFWPVQVSQLDRDALKKDRDQLFAEAFLNYDLGEPLYLENEISSKQAIEEASHKTFHDVLAEELDEFFQNEGKKLAETGFTLSSLWKVPGPLDDKKMDPMTQQRVANALRYLGFQNSRPRKGESRARVWAKGTIGTVAEPQEKGSNGPDFSF